MGGEWQRAAYCVRGNLDCRGRKNWAPGSDVREMEWEPDRGATAGSPRCPGNFIERTSELTPHSFREALDRLEVAVGRRAKRGVIAPQQVLADRAAARQEVERLYAARVGEEGWLVRHPHESMCQFWTKDPTGYVVPDSEVVRVFVTKGEAG